MAQFGYPLFYVLLAVGALLLLIGVLLPRRGGGNGAPAATLAGGPPAARGWRSWRGWGEYRGRIMACGALMLLLLCAISQQLGIDQNRGFIADREMRYEKKIRRLSQREGSEAVLRSEYMYMPEGDSLTVMSANNPSLAADYLWLTSLHYVSNAFRRGHKFDLLSRFYDTMLKLDPHWTGFQVNAGKVLSALEPDRFRVEEFYQHAVVENPGSLKLLYEAGRLFVVPPLDPAQQKKYSDRAVGWFSRLRTKLLARPRTPENLALLRDVEDLIGRLGIEAGYYGAAADLLRRRALDGSSPDAVRANAAQDWLTARSLQQVEELNDQAEAYRKQNGGFPPNLNALLKTLPNGGRTYARDAFGFPIEYNAQKGEAASRGVNARRAMQAASVINDLINVFHNQRGRLPKDLAELQQAVPSFFSAASPASAIVVDALGPKLNVVTGPLGPWKYDAEKGHIVLPPYCDAKTLFKPAERLWKKQ